MRLVKLFISHEVASLLSQAYDKIIRNKFL